MLEKFRATLRWVRSEGRMWLCVAKHPRRAWLPLFWMALAMIYLLMPFDIIPDTIFILGQLDDIVIAGALIKLAKWLIPKDIVEECKS